jgi:hypothetical protein
MTVVPGAPSKGAPNNPLGHLDQPIGGAPEPKLGMFSVGGMTVGLDDIRRAVSRRPERVLDAIAELGDTQETLIADYINSPLISEEQIRAAEGKRNRILGLQAVLQTFVGKLFEEEPDNDQQRN